LASWFNSPFFSQGRERGKPSWLSGAQRRDLQLPGVVIWEKSLLHNVLVDHMAKIALLVEQSHADHRHARIAGGFELIAGHVVSWGSPRYPILPWLRLLSADEVPTTR
jgi:hypothetical protein